MRNASATVLEPTSLVHHFQQPNPTGDFSAAFVDTRYGRPSGTVSVDQMHLITTGRLSEIRDTTFVVIRGSIEAVHLYDNKRSEYLPPTAVVLLSSGTGATTVIHIPSVAYDRIWGWLVIGRTVSLSGTVTRPDTKAPEYVTLSRLLLAGSDVQTRETYATQRALAQQAVTL
jgi:hypothetical protein